MKLDPYLPFCTKIKSKYIKEPSVRPETHKTWEEKIPSTFHNVGIVIGFLDKTLVAQEVKPIINIWNKE